MREELLMIPNRCRACHKCEAACIAAHHGMDIKEAMRHKNDYTSRVYILKESDLKTAVRCHKCNPAPCVEVCPTGAVTQGPRGNIHIQPEVCIGCGMCTYVCPYGVCKLETTPEAELRTDTTRADFSITKENGVSSVVSKARKCHIESVRCDLCISWRKRNGTKFTACQESCPFQAIGLITEDGSFIVPEPPKKPVKKAVGTKPAAAAKPAEKPAE